MRRVKDIPAKKPYRPPKLIIYGDLTHMTEARFGGKGRMDGVKGRKT